jgi:uncharacterized membrane protein YvbJ
MESKTLYCESCGAVVTPGAKFCNRCGKKIDAYQPTRATPRWYQRIAWQPVAATSALVVIFVFFAVLIAQQESEKAEQRANEYAAMPSSWKTIHDLIDQVPSSSERLKTLKKLVTERADTLGPLTAEQVSILIDSFLKYHKTEAIELLSKFTE